MPAARSLMLALLYSIAAHGIMTLNDFKSVDGDRQMGVGSLPVRLGINGAARTACWVMVLPQLGVIAILASWHRPLHALAVLALVYGQTILMKRFMASPVDKALQMSAFGVPLLVTGMMVAAFALRGLGG